MHIRCLFILLILVSQVRPLIGQVTIPDDLVYGVGQKLIETVGSGPSAKLSELSVGGASRAVFASCDGGTYYIGFELKYDLANSNTEVVWTADLSVMLLNGTTPVWSQAKTVSIKSADQTFISRIFHDVSVVCSSNYKYRIDVKTVTGSLPDVNVTLRPIYHKVLPDVFNTATTVSGFTVTNTDSERSSVAWSYQEKAVAYDLEWAFIDDYDGISLSNPPTVSELSNAFKQKEPVRVTVKNKFYNHTTFYPKGKLIYRVRAVGYNSANPTHRINGVWQYLLSSVLINNPNYNLTWQGQTVYAEDGKNKKVVTFFDGSLRERQTVAGAVNNQTNLTVVGESYYDFEGRKTVNVLPVPVVGTSLKFKDNFNLFIGENLNDSKRKSHYDNSGQADSPLQTGTGAGWFYSPSNNQTLPLTSYIPQAEGYAYSQVEYSDDGTGRVVRQSGVGKEFKLEGSHATKYYYGSANPWELKRLFGNNVGNATHYKKNMVIDPNGQASISYLDQEGRVIATALAGASPANVDPLITNVEEDEISVDLMDKNTIKNETGSSTFHTILNVQPTTYNFHYSLSALGSNLSTYGCVDCSYDLKIFITQSDGSLVDLGTIAGNESEVPGNLYYEQKGLTVAGCQNPTVGLDIDFSVRLEDLGDYRVVKQVIARELTFAQAKTIINANSSFINKAALLANSYPLNLSNCQICETGCSNQEELINTSIAEIASEDCRNIYQIILDESSAQSITPQTHARWCEYQRCLEDQNSAIFEKGLARVDRWSTAVALGYDVALSNVESANTDPFFKVGGNGYSSLNVMKLALNPMTIPGVKYATTANGPLTGSFTGSILQITDPSNTSYFILPNGLRDAVNGIHVLYYDIISRYKAGQITAAQRDVEIDKQRWSMFKMFYLEAKRKLKMSSISGYTASTCASAYNALLIKDSGYDQVSATDLSPTAIEAWARNNASYMYFANGNGFSATGPATSEDINAITYLIQAGCDGALDTAQISQVQEYVSLYLYAKKDNFLHVIDRADLDASDPLLLPLEALLNSEGCSLDSVAVVTPSCASSRNVSDNLIQNPLMRPEADCSTSITSCYTGWRAASGVPRKMPDYAIFLSAKCGSPSDAVRGSFVSALAPGKKYTLCFKYKVHSGTGYTSRVDQIKLQVSRSCNFIDAAGNVQNACDDGSILTLGTCGAFPRAQTPDMVVANSTFRDYVWAGSNLTNTSTYENACIEFTATEASTYFYIALMPSTGGIEEAIYIKDLAIAEYPQMALAGDEVKVCNAFTDSPVFSIPANIISQAVARCEATAAAERDQLIKYATEKLLDAEATIFFQERTQCLEGLTEEFTVEYAPREYHYTLYYYDQSANLVQTVPPKGVEFLVAGAVSPEHKYITRYYYNSLNQLIAQSTPDAGSSSFYYNNKGQLRASQNAQQTKENNYSYSRYDKQGRVVEVGEVNYTESIAALETAIEDENFPATGATDVTKTTYDVAKVGYTQLNLRSRVAYVEVFEEGKSASELIGTYYSYDIHGNVNTIIQKNADLEKRINYRYDLISGNVNDVFYQYKQPGGSTQADQFAHRYTYDEENRLTKVETSVDGYAWDTDAKYNYYAHGPLARLVLGEFNVQGLDYQYTLQGWIKGVNMPYSGDPGADGISGVNIKTGKDVFAYTLGYYENDYLAAKVSQTSMPDGRDKIWQGISDRSAYKGLYNGNIAWMETELTKIGQEKGSTLKGVQAMVYFYDQLHRIRNTKSLTNYTTTGFTSRTFSAAQAYDEEFTYDPNGNILMLTRRNELGPVADQFNYEYYNESNRLRFVSPVTSTRTISGAIQTDNKLYKDITVQGTATIPSGTNPELKVVNQIGFQTGFDTRNATNKTLHAYAIGDEEGVYNYDAIGNLIADQEVGTKITWTPYGKVRTVTHGDGTLVSFRYDGTGNRVEKKVVKAGVTTITRYVRDASGNVMAVYNGTSGTTLAEQPIYGSSRLGSYFGGRPIGSVKLGHKKFELTNHLGNVLAVVTDNIRMTTSAAWATVVSSTDYYAFGLEMPGRIYALSNAYTYGFNGKVKDENEEFGNTHYDYGLRIYNPRIGRFLSVDPLTKAYPWYTPYQFAGNTPIWAIDIDGGEPGIQSYIQSVQAQQLSQMSGGKHDQLYYRQKFAKAELVGATIGATGYVIVFGGTVGSTWLLGNWHHLVYNPLIQNEIAATIYGVGADDEWPIPAVGDNASKTMRYMYRGISKVPFAGTLDYGLGTLTLHKGAKFANEGERYVAKLLASEGSNVEKLAESTTKGVNTPDFLVDGVETEVKTISNISGNDIQRNIKKRIEEGLAQSGNVIIDVRNQAGASRDLMEQVIQRVIGNNKDKKLSFRVIGKDYDFKR